MKTLKVGLLASAKTLADWCRMNAGVAWGQRHICPFPAVECPLGKNENENECRTVAQKDWEKVLQDEEPEPQFHFGDKVRHDGMPAIFVRYSDKSHKAAYVLFEGGSILPERRVAELKAGWE